MPDPKIIRAQVAAIRKRVPDYWRDEGACAEASQAWAGGHNEHGVFLNGQDEVIARHKNAEASATIVESPNGLFTFGLHFTGSMSGFGFAPSIWKAAYDSRQAALQAALEELLESLERDEPNGKAAAEETTRIRQQVMRRLKPQKIELFTQALTDDASGANLLAIHRQENRMADDPSEPAASAESR